jgi:hypothetical protein
LSIDERDDAQTETSGTGIKISYVDLRDQQAVDCTGMFSLEWRGHDGQPAAGKEANVKIKQAVEKPL